MYDLIVVGDDLASHVAAAYASQNGLNTLLIAETGLGGLQLISDFVFNIDPSPLSGLGTDETALSVLSEMKIVPPENHAAPVNPAFQVILPEHRIDFFNTPESLIAELIREFPEMDTEIREYYSAAIEASTVFQNWLTEHLKLQPQTLNEYFSYLKIFPLIFRYKFSAAKFDKAMSQNAALEKTWEAQHALLCSNHDDMFTFGSAFQYCAPLRGISYWPQGRQFLFNALIQNLESCKGLYLNNYQVVSMTGEKTFELELKAPDGSLSKVSSKQLIISTKSEKIALLPGGHKYINLSDWFRPAKISYYPFTIFLGVNEKCLPQQIARHVAVVSDVTRDTYDHNLIILETGLPETDASISGNRLSLSATVYLSEKQENWTVDALKKEADSILERLEEFFPFLNGNILLNNIDRSIELALSCRKVISPKYKVRNAFFTSFAAKSHKTRYDNVFLTGASLLTDAGFDAEILSGKIAALHALEKRN